jgi:hypothetical protein
MAFLAALLFLSPAAATFAPRQDPHGFSKNWSPPRTKNLAPELAKELSRERLNDSSAPEQKQEFRITDQTEVELDGHPCKYKDVPNDAVIVLLEVASDSQKAILKIHFRSKK